jgi:hypothetical protein
MPLFLFIFYIFITSIHSFNHIHTIHISIAIRRGLSPSPHRLKAQWEKAPCGAELGPAIPQADVLPTEPRRTITEPRRTITEPRRTIVTEPRRTMTKPRRTMMS